MGGWGWECVTHGGHNVSNNNVSVGVSCPESGRTDGGKGGRLLMMTLVKK